MKNPFLRLRNSYDTVTTLLRRLDTSMTYPRTLTPLDRLCLNIDQALRSVFGTAQSTRSSPGDKIPESLLSPEERKHTAGLMRVNHAGEVCAQALYQGQGLTSRREDVKEKMQQASKEENDHLAWCALRLSELGSHTSYLNPLWYAGSFTIGLTAGLIGDRWSLGFLAETENQVVKHLQSQLNLLPAQDNKSAAILQQMQQDEAHHRDDAKNAGGADLPQPIKLLMSCASKIMVKTAYWI